MNEVDSSKYNHIIFYSDGCTYQNRNSILANTLILVSKKTGITITQKFLEVGHTQMECDSMHSAIEKQLRNREVYSPDGYFEPCRSARVNPKPYKVEYLSHNFFLKYSNLKFINSLRPWSKTGDPVVTDLKCIQYDPNGSIQTKLNFSDPPPTLTFLEESRMCPLICLKNCAILRFLLKQENLSISRKWRLFCLEMCTTFTITYLTIYPHPVTISVKYVHATVSLISNAFCSP